jgi:hypothetical protein
LALSNQMDPQQQLPGEICAVIQALSTSIGTAQIDPSQLDPAQHVAPHIFGIILAMADNIGAAARVNKQWASMSSVSYFHILLNYRSSALLRKFLPERIQLSNCREDVLRAVGRLQAHLRDLDPRAAAILSDPSFPIGHVALLERLEADATLSKFFDRLLDQIPPQQRPHLPDNFNERVTFIREWINNHANDAVLALVTDIHLDRCSLYSLPPEIGRLANLRRLRLSYNQLTTLPPEIGQLRNLEDLWLMNNQLATLPREIGQLANLVSLMLFNNHLTDLPQEMGQLANLVSLMLFNNHLTDLPQEMGQLANLQELRAFGNPLSEAARSFLEHFAH